MENRSVRLESRNYANATKEFMEEASLSDAELQALIELFQLLDGWDRELVQ